MKVMTMTIRLIDKDRFIADVVDRRYSQASMRLIREQPVIDAIPVEWIKEHYSWLTMAMEMIEHWEKENETN